MVNLDNEILNNLIHFLKLLIYFDTYELQNINIKHGGAPSIAMAAAKKVAAKKAAPQAQGTMGPNMMKKATNMASSVSKPESSDGNSGEAAKKAEQEEITEKKSTSAFESAKRMAAIFIWLKDIVMSILTLFGKYALKFASTMLFAATFPIIPFFAVMAGMYGITKYFLYKLRKL